MKSKSSSAKTSGVRATEGGPVRALDLSREVPRSPRDRVGGLVHLGRMIDKARAKSAGTLSDYLYPCPLDQVLLEFLGLTGEAFLDAAATEDDARVVEWVRQQGTAHQPEDIERWNREFLSRGPNDEESRRRFLAKRERLAPGRTDLTAWVDLLDVEEGRPCPPAAG